MEYFKQRMKNFIKTNSRKSLALEKLKWKSAAINEIIQKYIEIECVSHLFIYLLLNKGGPSY